MLPFRRVARGAAPIVPDIARAASDFAGVSPGSNGESWTNTTTTNLIDHAGNNQTSMVAETSHSNAVDIKEVRSHLQPSLPPLVIRSDEHIASLVESFKRVKDQKITMVKAQEEKDYILRGEKQDMAKQLNTMTSKATDRKRQLREDRQRARKSKRKSPEGTANASSGEADASTSSQAPTGGPRTSKYATPKDKAPPFVARD
ncbi:hypothetical protein N7488_011388 [Penicillium malachiteum]|nr:hypothetical protein N7488_011388 [Penicillium malachiteum]